MDISVVIPLFNEEESLPELSEWITRVMNENNFSYEVIMVDDGSTDCSWKVIEEISNKNTMTTTIIKNGPIMNSPRFLFNVLIYLLLTPYLRPLNF